MSSYNLKSSVPKLSELSFSSVFKKSRTLSEPRKENLSFTFVVGHYTGIKNVL